MIKSFSLTASLVATLLCCEVFAVQNQKLDYFVFLVTGKAAQGTPKEEIQKMQSAHLGNFERLAKLGELVAAGPCVDPEKTVRGIVVINGQSMADAESKFSQDPYVTEGFMKTEIHQYRSVVGRFVIPDDITKLEQSVIVILSQSERWPSDEAEQKKLRGTLESFAKAQHAAGK